MHNNKPHLQEPLVVKPIRFSSEKTDDRKNKRYLRTVSLRFSVDLPGGNKHAEDWRNIFHGEPSLLNFVWQKVIKAVKDRDWGELSLVHQYAGNSRWEAYEAFAFRVSFEADKPSSILDEDECIREIGEPEELRAFFQAVIDEGLAEGREAHDARERAITANALLESYSTWASDKAKKAVRWDQRLAALKAELQAEYEAQAHECLDELSKKEGCGVTFGGAPEGWQPDERCTKAAKGALVERMKTYPLPNSFRGIPSRTSDEGYLKPEDVK